MPTQPALGRSFAAIAISTATLFLASCDEEPTLTFAPPQTEASNITLSPANVVPTPPESMAIGDATIAVTPDAGLRRLVIGGEFSNLEGRPVEPDNLPAPSQNGPMPQRIVNIFKADTAPFDESTGMFFISVERVEVAEEDDGTFSGTFEDTINLVDPATVNAMLAGQFYISISTRKDEEDSPLIEELRAQMIFP
ncbi:MAG: hypothetical protein AAF704_14725 [Cyanobacteria bacterium P01_D01_bin.123]